MQQAEQNLYEYAVIRYVPKVEREEFVNVGLLMMCKRKGWIKARVRTEDASRLKALNPEADVDSLCRHLESMVEIASGGAGPIASLVAEERFRWLSAVRSACIQTSRPHPGKTPDLDAAFERLYEELVS